MTPANDTQAATPSARDRALREWSDRTLELPPDTHGAEYRRRMLQQIETAEYVLPETSRAAMRLRSHLSNGSRCHREYGAESDLTHLNEEHEERVREELLVYSAEFFELPPVVRLQRWEAIRERVIMIPRLLNWLNLLQPGLEITFDDLTNLPEPVQQLARHIVELFPLPPAQRARRRREVIAGLRGEVATQAADNGLLWEETAERLREGWPHLAALGPDIVDELKSYSRRKMQFGFVVVARCQAVAKMREDARLAAGVANESFFGLWKYVVAGLVIFGLRTWLGSADTPRPQPTSPYGPASLSTIRGEQREQVRKTLEAYKERSARRAAGIRDGSGSGASPAERRMDRSAETLLKLFGDEAGPDPAKRKSQQALKTEDDPPPRPAQPDEATGPP